MLATSVVAASSILLLLPVKLCLFAVLLRTPCPGCGMTRAVVALLGGDFHAANAWHPLAFVIAPSGAVAIGRHFVAYVRTGDAWRVPAPLRVTELAVGALVALLFAVWVARFWGYFGGPVAV